jgi:MoaA/NifB/PqqE/SkfB family radical SAM enzyme
MVKRSFQEQAKVFAVKRVLNYMDRDPQKNIPKILDWLESHDKDDAVTSPVRLIRSAVTDPESNWYTLVSSLWTDMDSGVRRRLFENFVINASLIGSPKQLKTAKENGCNIPYAILMDPTSACNLHCAGCWAAEYDKRLNLSLEELDGVIRQGNELGVFFFIYSGGEPLVRKDDIIRLCDMHPDCVFLSFTNGTLIDEDFADELLRVKNFVPAISVEGFREATDARRGAGTYDKVVRAMELLKARKLPFGISCCYTRANTEVIGSEEYMDAMIALGAKFAWFFTYMPVGADAVPGLMVTAEQRAFMYHRLRQYRRTKPIFTLDFWNDGEYVKGCIAGGRSYLHINANGDIEPCAFIHYADSNIREKTLLEACKSPLFMQYRQNQPFSDNMLRPCPLLDNPGRLQSMVEASGAASTDMQNPEDVRSLTAKCAHAAECWAPVADRLWDGSRYVSKVKR